MQDRESAVEADWWRGGASGSQSPAEKSTWAFLGTLDSPSSPLVISDYKFFPPFFPNTIRIYPHSTRLIEEILSILYSFQFSIILLFFNAVINSQFLFLVTSRAKIGTINSNYRGHVNHQLCLYF